MGRQDNAFYLMVLGKKHFSSSGIFSGMRGYGGLLGGGGGDERFRQLHGANSLPLWSYCSCTLGGCDEQADIHDVACES